MNVMAKINVRHNVNVARQGTSRPTLSMYRGPQPKGPNVNVTYIPKEMSHQKIITKSAYQESIKNKQPIESPLIMIYWA